MRLPLSCRSRSGQEAAASLSIAAYEIGMRGETIAREGMSETRDVSRTASLLGEGHQGRTALLGRCHQDEKRHRHLLGILKPSGQADNRFVAHLDPLPPSSGIPRTPNQFNSFLEYHTLEVVLSRELLNIMNGGGGGMAEHTAKAMLYDALAQTAKALSNGRRAELVDVLAQGERPVEELADEIGQTVANTSQHLQRLLRSGLVKTRRDGTRIYYSLSSPVVHALWRTMRQTAEEHVAGLQQLANDYLGDRSKLRTITRDALQARLSDGDVVVLDVRPEPEYTAGHIRGAITIPVRDLKSRLGEIPAGAEVVAYCRGPYCVYADDAVRLMTRNGLDAARLEDGFPEWVAARLPIEGRTP
jgi:rhodanese-related sulfurtransferase/predicted transcriptional regulator